MITTTSVVSLKSNSKSPGVDNLKHTLKFDPSKSKEDDGQVDWLNLPDPLLSLITDKLIHFKDYVRFGAVCKPWHSVYIQDRHQFRRCKPQLPLLMLPTHHNEDHDCQTRSLFSLTEKTLYNFHPPVHYNLLCPGSCFGWVVTVSPYYAVTLFNPFVSNPSKNTINLPPLTEFEVTNNEDTYRRDRRFLIKVVLSADPMSTQDYVAMAVYGFYRLAFFKPGDNKWTSLDPFFCILDVIFSRDKFHTLNQFGEVYLWNINHDPPTQEKVSPPLLYGGKISKRYIVESSGLLLQVLRFIEFDDPKNRRQSSYSTIKFHVFKLDPVLSKWIEIHNLQGHVLFLGDNSSFSLLASEFPECKPNSIYYTDDLYGAYNDKEQYKIGPHDMGLFSVEDGTIEKYYPTESKIFLPAPIWIQPTLCG